MCGVWHYKKFHNFWKNEVFIWFWNGNWGINPGYRRVFHLLQIKRGNIVPVITIRQLLFVRGVIFYRTFRTYVEKIFFNFCSHFMMFSACITRTVVLIVYRCKEKYFSLKHSIFNNQIYIWTFFFILMLRMLLLKKISFPE